MSRITSKEFEKLQTGLRELYAHHSLDTLPEAALKLAGTLVPNDLSAYNEVDPIRRRLQVVMEPAERQNEILKVIPKWERYMHQHPVLAHYLAHPADGPRKISDFLTDKEYRQLELYTEFYEPIGANYQMAANMPSPSPVTVALAFNREKKDFNEHDRMLLEMLRPHLRQAYENATVISELEAELGRAYDVLERMDRGTIVIDEKCRIHSASPSAIRYSAEYFLGDRNATLTVRLPSVLQRWAMDQMTALRQESNNAIRPRPIFFDGENGRLILRIVPTRQAGKHLIVMQMTRTLESASPFEELGLSKREAEVLRWMIEGKSNPQIGDLFGISRRTVDKHAENLYAKLGVDCRSQAIVRALEWVRW